MAQETPAPGYLITFSKQTSQMGEVIQINTNMPVGSSRDEIAQELQKIAGALDDRLSVKNKEVIEATGKSLKEMGIEVPGFNA